MKKPLENKAIEMDREGQGTQVESNIAHTLKPGEQEYSFPHDGLTVVARSTKEAEEKRAEVLRKRKSPENKEEGEEIINKDN